MASPLRTTEVLSEKALWCESALVPEYHCPKFNGNIFNACKYILNTQYSVVWYGVGTGTYTVTVIGVDHATGTVKSNTAVTLTVN